MSLARLCWNKDSRHRHDPSVVGIGVNVGVINFNFRYTSISVITEDIYLNLEHIFTIKGATFTIKGHNSRSILQKIIPPFCLDIHHPASPVERGIRMQYSCFTNVTAVAHMAHIIIQVCLLFLYLGFRPFLAWAPKCLHTEHFHEIQWLKLVLSFN